MRFAAPVVGPITSPFGPRPPLPDHNGIDWGWLLAQPVTSRRVLSPAAGLVRVSWSTLMGWQVFIELEGGWRLRLAHLASVAVRDGSHVAVGTYLGVMGDTGTLAQGVHLHVDLYTPRGARVDPQPYFTLPFPGISPAGPPGTTIDDLLEPDTMTHPRIIAPHGLDARAVVGGGLAYVFPTAGELAHYRNFERPTTPSIDATTTVGDDSMTPAARQAVFETIVRVHQSAQGIANQLAALPAQLDRVLDDEFSALQAALTTSGEPDVAGITAALSRMPAEVVAAIKAAL